MKSPKQTAADRARLLDPNVSKPRREPRDARPASDKQDQSSKPVRPAKPGKPGLASRQVATATLQRCLRSGTHLDDAIEQALSATGHVLEGRDRAFVRLLATTVLRRRGELDFVLGQFLAKPLPRRSGPLPVILLSAAAQLLFLETPAHAAIGLAVDEAKADRDAQHFAGLANAVLRRVTSEGPARLQGLANPAVHNIPDELLAGWTRAYGADAALRIAQASLVEPPLDISVKSDPSGWATKLGAIALPGGTVRITAHGRIEELPGFAEGEWWVQDAAAAIPVRLLGDVRGLEIADLCAAPGGKTAQLVRAGATVTAVDVSDARLVRMSANLKRLGIEVPCIAADLDTWEPGRSFDAVLLDAPCTATGTIRRHPEILYASRRNEVARMATAQSRLLARAGQWVKPGGLLLYCTCSLEPEEGEDQIGRFLTENTDFVRVPVEPSALEELPGAVTPDGDFRSLPHFTFGPSAPEQGMDGFFAARLRRVG